MSKQEYSLTGIPLVLGLGSRIMIHENRLSDRTTIRVLVKHIIMRTEKPKSASGILAAMCVAMLLGYVPWYNFSAVLKYIAADFGLGPADTGLILAAFQAGYVLVVPATGWLSDRVGVRRVLIVATLLTGCASTAFALLAVDKWTLLLLRLLTGLSAGAIYVPGMSLLAGWFPPEKRGGALGAYTGSLVAAYALGYLVAAPLAATHGWRVAILLTSLPVFVAVLVLWLFVREAPASAGAALPDREVVAESFATTKPAWLITLAYCGHMWEQYAFWGWVGPFLLACAVATGMPAGEAAVWSGKVAAFVILLGAPSSLLWGHFADRRGLLRGMMIASTASLLAVSVAGFLYGQPLWLVVSLVAWAGFWVVADSALYKAALAGSVPVAQRGTYLGVQSAVGYAVTIVSPILFGALLQEFNGNTDPAGIRMWWQAFVMLGAGALVAPLASLFLARRVE
jgi:MFS family permease